LTPQNFDYIIIGGGLAGLQLALSLSEDPFFKDMQIAIIDPSAKNTNDKTWCFWEQGPGKWDSIITKSWEIGRFITPHKNIELQLLPYSYKMLKSLDFYNFAKNSLNLKPNFKFIVDEIESINEESGTAIGKSNSYKASHFFDSRISSEYLEDSTSTKIFQHFKGYEIEVDNPVFNTSEFIMMDFRLKFKDSTSFTYVLPISSTKALVEFTFFTPFLLEESIYDEYLQAYIENILKIKEYRITQKEKGIIPMTDHPFHKESSRNLTKIGTAGSWVKGSTGYSFKHTEKKVAKLISNLKQGNAPEHNLLNNRSRFYDAIFLDVLANRNDLGEELFTKFYSKNTPQDILKYLDEETGIKEEVKIMWSLFHPEFIKSFFRKLF